MWRRSGPGEWINVTPLWFGWIAGRGCTVLVDRNPELQAAMFQGHATVLEDAGQEGVDEHLEEVCWLMGTKYPGGQGETRDRSAGRVVFEPSPLITWDNLKLPKG